MALGCAIWEVCAAGTYGGGLTRFRICKAELEALRGLPHEARTLYVEGLRPYMEFDGTRIVGIKRKISYQACYELLEVLPEPGSRRPAYQPTREQLRALFRVLERAGLLVRVPQKRFSGLVFECVLAEAGLVRLNEEPHGEPHGEPHQSGAVDKSASVYQSSNLPSLVGKPSRQQQPQQQPEEPHTPGSSSYHKYKQLTYSGANVVSIQDADPQRGFKTVIGDWFPESEVVRTLVKVRDIDPVFVEIERQDFQVYWASRCTPAVSWDAKFMQHIQIRWNRKAPEWQPPKLIPGSELYRRVSELLRYDYGDFMMGGYE